ncbi:MAG TPA: DUF433 domain-containing protein [Chloroflexota bacterium]|nr:DUF433 domain-containing protein [Chloroflexota bacterium]
MTDHELRERIEIDPKVMVGKPCIRGTRIPVRMIVNLLAHGATLDEIFEEYPRLSGDDIRACLLYAVDALDECYSASTLAASSSR